jgi:hypothetical protein
MSKIIPQIGAGRHWPTGEEFSLRTRNLLVPQYLYFKCIG